MDEAERNTEEVRLHKERRNELRQKALERGLLLRQTEHGYALLDVRKNHIDVDVRMVHLNLDGVEEFLSSA